MDTKFPKWAQTNKLVMSAVEYDSDYARRVLETGKYTTTNKAAIAGLKREAYKMQRAIRFDAILKEENEAHNQTRTPESAQPDSDA